MGFGALRHNATAIRLLPLLMLVFSALLVPDPGHSARAATEGFVTRSGTQLMLNGSPFRFAGTNMYWLGLDDSQGYLAYPSHFRVADAMETAREMGANVIRTHAALSTGCEECILRAPGDYNEAALRQLDWVIKAAGDYGLRLILPLTDNYHYYHGGKHDFTDWRGLDNEEDFYTDPRVIQDFKQHISVLINRVNRYTGIAYKDDPAILAWEAGNELASTPEWTHEIAAHIRSQDQHHLIASGRGGADVQSLADTAVDLYTGHYYTLDVDRLTTIVNRVHAANKAYFVGEYDWITTDRADFEAFVRAIEDLQIAGDVYWHLLGHRDAYGWVDHSEDFDLHYPGETREQRERAMILRTHAYAMRGEAAPALGIPAAPVITRMRDTLAWRGVVGAAIYSVERATEGPDGPWQVICDRCVTDRDLPWTDETRPQGAVYYRVRAHNADGVGGPYSIVSGATMIDDTLASWRNSLSHTPNLALTQDQSELFAGDRSRARRSDSGRSAVTWYAPGMRRVEAIAYFWTGQPVEHLEFATSPDGKHWTTVSPTITNDETYWPRYTYTLGLLASANYLRIEWGAPSGEVWSPQLGSITIVAAPPGSDLCTARYTDHGPPGRRPEQPLETC